MSWDKERIAQIQLPDPADDDPHPRLLLDWEKRYAPQAPEDVPDKRFVEACHRLPWAEYQLDILLQGDSYERGETVSELTTDGYIRKLQARLRKERYHEQPCLD